MAPATIYAVKGPHGIYYAVRNHQTGKVWTERTELAAQQQADEEGLCFVQSETIDHAQLLELMISHAATQLSPSGKSPARSPDKSPEHGGKMGFSLGVALTRLWGRKHHDHEHGNRVS